MSDVIYFDNNATTRPHQQVIKKVVEAMNLCYANPSSSHTLGVKAKSEMENARKILADALDVSTDQLCFTSGASESNTMILMGFVEKYGHKNMSTSTGTVRIITSPIEHASVLSCCNEITRLAPNFVIDYVDVDKYGIIDLDDLEGKIRRNTVLITIMAANNEIGTIQPITEIGKIARKHNIHFHCDATQVAGKFQIYPSSSFMDSMSMSAHKAHGPKGIGALWMRKGCSCARLIHGGKQEGGRRAGTENVPGIAGYGEAIRINFLPGNLEKIKALENMRKYIRDAVVKMFDAKINGPPEIRTKSGRLICLPNTLSFSVPGIDSRKMMKSLAINGVCLNVGSACNLGKRSKVMQAIGLSEDLEAGTFRVSLSIYNTMEECKKFIKILDDLL